MTHRPDPARALPQPDPHRSDALPLDLRILGGITVEQHLRSAEAGMRQLAETTPGWRMNP